MNFQEILTQRLEQLQPIHIQVSNESHQHSGYFEGKQTHFKVIIVSELFRGYRPVQRHQKIYALIPDLMTKGNIHALAIHAYTPDEWVGQAPESPLCVHAPK